jgi:hypothetical protein
MIETTFWAVLMAMVGLAPLLPQSFNPTQQTAIALTAVTVATDPEKRVTSETDALSKIHLARIRHPRRPGLDKDDGSWQGKTIEYSMASSQGLPRWDLAVTAVRSRVVSPTFRQPTYTSTEYGGSIVNPAPVRPKSG